MVGNLGPDVPLHFSAFHPDFKVLDVEPTPSTTLTRARDIARRAGLNYVFTGNVSDPGGQSTYCPSCGTLVIERDWYTLGTWALDHGKCAKCGKPIAGRFDDEPGRWGARRAPIRLRR